MLRALFIRSRVRQTEGYLIMGPYSPGLFMQGSSATAEVVAAKASRETPFSIGFEESMGSGRQDGREKERAQSGRLALVHAFAMQKLLGRRWHEHLLST